MKKIINFKKLLLLFLTCQFIMTGLNVKGENIDLNNNKPSIKYLDKNKNTSYIIGPGDEFLLEVNEFTNSIRSKKDPREF